MIDVQGGFPDINLRRDSPGIDLEGVDGVHDEVPGYCPKSILGRYKAWAEGQGRRVIPGGYSELLPHSA